MRELWTYTKSAVIPKWLEGRSMAMPGGELIVMITNQDEGDPLKVNVREGAALYFYPNSGIIGLNNG